MDDINIDYQKLLKGCYEAELLPDDFSTHRAVPDFAFNILNRVGLLYHPVVDEDRLDRGVSKPLWPEGKAFAVCLTHDVDLVTQYSYSQKVRLHSQAICGVRNPLRLARKAVSLSRDLFDTQMLKSDKDPLHCYEKWLEVEEKASARSTFFFWPGWKSLSKHHFSDCLYDLTDRVVFDNTKATVAEMIKEIGRRGFEIGLHPSWYSYSDGDEMKRQKDSLESAAGREVVSVRQHYLHYDIRITPRVHVEAGFKYDSTLGFNDNIGFRFGTCYPWYLSHLKTERELPILEIPLIIQDGAMLSAAKGMRLDKKTAFLYVIQLCRAVEKVGGVLTLLWHPDAIINTSSWDLYSDTLKYLTNRNAWMASIEEIGKHWMTATGDIDPDISE